jgi:transcriptional regulator with XRE-family HTH domain
MPKIKKTTAQARQIKAFLVLNGLTQARAAEIMGLTPQHMSLKVKGKYPFTTDELTALFRHTGGVEPDEFFRAFLPGVKILRQESA